jgi:hypothetical protein
MPLVGRHGSVRLVRGRASRADGALSAYVSAGLRDRRSQGCTGIRAQWVSGRANSARRARDVACGREPSRFKFSLAQFDQVYLQISQHKCSNM